jgi:hypothetical protein
MPASLSAVENTIYTLTSLISVFRKKGGVKMFLHLLLCLYPEFKEIQQRRFQKIRPESQK